MGDRVLFQVKGTKGFSPIAYGHWAGADAGAICRRLQTRMAERKDDVDRTFARLVQEMTGGCNGDSSFGCWNAKALLTEADSHGDAGVILIDVSRSPFVFTCMGGYMVVGADGFPTSKYQEE